MLQRLRLTMITIIETCKDIMQSNVISQKYIVFDRIYVDNCIVSTAKCHLQRLSTLLSPDGTSWDLNRTLLWAVDDRPHELYSMAERLCNRSSAASRESCAGVEEPRLSEQNRMAKERKHKNKFTNYANFLKQLWKLRLFLTSAHEVSEDATEFVVMTRWSPRVITYCGLLTRWSPHVITYCGLLTRWSPHVITYCGLLTRWSPHVITYCGLLTRWNPRVIKYRGLLTRWNPRVITYRGLLTRWIPRVITYCGLLTR